MRIKERRYLPDTNTDQEKVDSLMIDKRSPLLLSAIIAGAVLILSIVFCYNMNQKQLVFKQMESMNQSLIIKENIINFVARYNTALQSLRNVILTNSPITEREFSALSEELFRSLPYIKRISWAPLGKIERVYPLGLNRSLLHSNIPRRILNELAQTKDNLAVSVDVRHNQLFNFSLHSLLMLENIGSELNGVISIDLDLTQFLKVEAFLNNKLSLPFVLSEKQTDQTLIDVKADSLVDAEQVYATSVLVGNKTWMLHTLTAKESGIPWLHWFIALAIFLITWVLCYKAIYTYQQRSIDVKAGAYRANYDLLTGLPNRYHFTRRLSETMAESKAVQKDFAVFFMDIDHFKQMNDQLGQGAGDSILRTFTRRLQGIIHNNDLMARISGDEFVIIAHNVDDVIKADLLAEKLKKSLQQPIEFSGQHHFISVSMGVAMYPIDGEDAKTLLHHADQAMYEAKREGRNRHVFFNEDMREKADDYSNIHDDIIRGLNQGEFELYYQPMVNVKTEMVDICEALMRWNHPEKGLLMPDYFLEVAERTGAIRDIGIWAFSQACRDIRTFNEGDIDVKVSINHSVSEYYSTRAFEHWKRILNENQVSGDNFIFEIPEALLMDTKSIRMNVVTAMRKLGVQFAIDDFGTGHSAISYLRNYPAQILKIDASLINGMLDNEKDRTLVKVVLMLAKSLGKEVVAEGVESDVVAQELRLMGCNYLQGHLLFEPKPINKLIPYLHQHMFAVEERQLNEESDTF